MKNKTVFFIFFFLITFNLFSGEIYKYIEQTKKNVMTITWKVNEDEKGLKLEGEDDISITTILCSKDFEINKFIYKEKKGTTEYTFILDKDILTAEGTVNGKAIKTENKISLPWIQQLGFGLKPFMKSSSKKLNFCLLNPNDFTIQKMVATKDKLETININSESYKTQNVTVTLPGFKSMFWKAELWFDVKTDDLIKYAANKGPNTPVTTMTFQSVKKEGILDKLKESLMDKEK